MKLLEMIKSIYISCHPSALELSACKKIKDLTFLSQYKAGNIPEISNISMDQNLKKNIIYLQCLTGLCGASEISLANG